MFEAGPKIELDDGTTMELIPYDNILGQPSYTVSVSFADEQNAIPEEERMLIVEQVAKATSTKYICHMYETGIKTNKELVLFPVNIEVSFDSESQCYQANLEWELIV